MSLSHCFNKLKSNKHNIDIIIDLEQGGRASDQPDDIHSFCSLAKFWLGKCT